MSWMSRRESTKSVETKSIETKSVEKEAWAVLLVLYAVWGSVFLANRFALESFPPLLLNAVRFLGGGGILYAILRLKGIKDASPKVWAGSALIGSLRPCSWPLSRSGRSFSQEYGSVSRTGSNGPASSQASWAWRF